MIGTFAIAPLALLAGAAQDNAAPLKPLTPWIVQTEENACVLARTFGDEKDKPVSQLLIQQMPLEPELEVMLVSNYQGAPFRKMGKARLSLLPGVSEISIEIEEYVAGKGNILVRKISLKDDQVSDFKTASSLRLTIDGAEAVQIALSSTAKALTRTGECQDALLRKWGFDPVVMNALSSLAQPMENEAKEISYLDYPREALRKGLNGSLRVLFTVDAKGRATNCRNIESSSPLFGNMGCAILNRLRFKPAHDANGQPIASPATRAFKFVLPR